MSSALVYDTDALKARLWEKLDQLPQRDAIEKSDATQWIDYMAHIMPREAMWHMIRAGGVGGSEIGSLVRNYLGQSADFGHSATQWAEGKLLRRVPDIPKGVTERGHFMEPIIAQRLYEELGTQRDQAAFDRLSAAKGIHKWMRYSPDDIIFLDKPTSIPMIDGFVDVQGRVLVDYKAPTVVEQTPKISFQYVCQLHQGAILCREQGIDLSATMLTQFDWANYALKHDLVEINDELCDLIPVVGEHYWNFVLRGEIPAPIVKQKANLDPETQKAWMEVAERLGQINAMKTELEKRSNELRDKIITGLGLDKMRLHGATVNFPGAISITSRTSIDEDAVRAALGEEKITEALVKEKSIQYDTAALVARLKELGEDVKPYRKLTKLDPDLTIDLLVEAKKDPADFIVETQIIRVDKEMKAQAIDWAEMSFPPLHIPGESDGEHDPEEASPIERPRVA